MTDDERRRLAGIRESCYVVRRFPDGHTESFFSRDRVSRADLDWLLTLARRCDLAEAELDRVAPSLAMRGRCGYSFEPVPDGPEAGEARAARLGYDHAPCPRCGLRRRVSSAGEWACDTCGAKGTCA